MTTFTFQKMLLALVLALLASMGSYAYFQSTSKFKFVALNTQDTEVKGVSTQQVFITPLPKDSIELSSTISSTSKTRDVESTQSLASLLSFYRSYFTNDGWEVSSESSAGDFYIIEFVKNDNHIKLTLAESTEFKTVLLNIQEDNN